MFKATIISGTDNNLKSEDLILTKQQSEYLEIFHPYYEYLRHNHNRIWIVKDSIKKLDSDSAELKEESKGESEKTKIIRINKLINNTIKRHIFVDCNEWELIDESQYFTGSAFLINVDNIVITDKTKKSGQSAWFRVWMAHEYYNIKNHDENFGVIQYCGDCDAENDKLFADLVMKVPYIQHRNGENDKDDDKKNGVKNDEESDEDDLTVSRDNFAEEIDRWCTFMYGVIKLTDAQMNMIITKKYGKNE